MELGSRVGSSMPGTDEHAGYSSEIILGIAPLTRPSPPRGEMGRWYGPIWAVSLSSGFDSSCTVICPGQLHFSVVCRIYAVERFHMSSCNFLLINSLSTT